MPALSTWERLSSLLEEPTPSLEWLSTLRQASRGITLPCYSNESIMAAATTRTVAEPRYSNCSGHRSYYKNWYLFFRHSSLLVVATPLYPQLSCWWKLPQPGSLRESFHLPSMVSAGPTLTTRSWWQVTENSLLNPFCFVSLLPLQKENFWKNYFPLN